MHQYKRNGDANLSPYPTQKIIVIEKYTFCAKIPRYHARGITPTSEKIQIGFVYIFCIFRYFIQSGEKKPQHFQTRFSHI